MADNIAVTEGSGKTIRADEVGSALLQVVKIGLGADGAEDLLLDSGQQAMAASLPVAVASDNYVLSVSPFKTIAGTPTIGTTAYDANDCVGGKGTLTSAIRSSGGGAIWQSLHIIDKGNQKAALVIQVYNADPTSATLVNGSAIVHSTDIDKVIRTVLVASTDYSTVGGEAFADVNVAQAVVSAGTNLYYSAMALGTPTYTSTSDLIFRFDFIQG